jgi:ABC-2 type transport system permease protein
MRRFKQLLHKDFLLLVRDFWGLTLLFLMPWALVVLMTYLQDSTFRSVNENHIPLLLLDNDGDTIGAMITRQLLASGIFEVSEARHCEQSEAEVEAAVARGDYLIGVIIPSGATANLRAKVRAEIEHAFGAEEQTTETKENKEKPTETTENKKKQKETKENQQKPTETKENKEKPTETKEKPTETKENKKKQKRPPDGTEIRILTDPTVKQSFRRTLVQTVNENALRVQNKLLLSEITRQVNRLVPMPIDLNPDINGALTVSEKYAVNPDGKTKLVPDSTQHNVPAWSMFAIFFIVISLSSNMIRERESGCFNRLLTMPCPFSLYLLSKVAVYLCVCLLQLTLIIVSGMFLIPLLGLPALQLGSNFAAIAATGVSSSLAAIGYGVAIGSIARTNQQASIFGAVSVVILAALGGVWIPTFIMPRFMQYLSHISPLNWGLNAFNELFVRNSAFIDILPYVSTSLLFFVITTSISYGLKRWNPNRL